MGLYISDLRIDDQITPLGRSIAAPRLSWNVINDNPAIRAILITSYRIQVFCTPLGTEIVDLTQEPLYDSGIIRSSCGVHTYYDGPALEYRRRYFWRVQIEDASGETSHWSAPTWFETGIDIFDSLWIGAPAESPELALTEDNSAIIAPAQYLRKQFRVPEGMPLVTARISVAALGWYQLYINGIDITADSLVPRFTSFSHRVEFHTYDIGHTLRSDNDNIIALILADGRFRGTLSGHHRHAVFGVRTAITAQLEIHTHQSIHRIITDESWLTHPGPIRAADPMLGTIFDSTRRLDGWDNNIELIGLWLNAEIMDVSPPRPVSGDSVPERQLVPAIIPPVRGIAMVSAVCCVRINDIRTIIDFGQNLVGVADIDLGWRESDHPNTM